MAHRRRQGARRRPPPRARPPRHQARERHGARRRRREGARLRHRAADGGEGRPQRSDRRDRGARHAHRRRPRRGHAVLHGARTDAGRVAQRGRRPVLLGRHGLRAPHRRAPLDAGERFAPAGGADPHARGRATPREEAGDPAGGRRLGSRRAEQVRSAPVRDDGGSRRRARAARWGRRCVDRALRQAIRPRPRLRLSRPHPLGGGEDRGLRDQERALHQDTAGERRRHRCVGTGRVVEGGGGRRGARRGGRGDAPSCGRHRERSGRDPGARRRPLCGVRVADVHERRSDGGLPRTGPPPASTLRDASSSLRGNSSIAPSSSTPTSRPPTCAVPSSRAR